MISSSLVQIELDTVNNIGKKGGLLCQRQRCL